MSEWISVEDRIPEPYEKFIGYFICPNGEGMVMFSVGNPYPDWPPVTKLECWQPYNEAKHAPGMPLPVPPEVKDE